jgi:glycosyltransferase involved in cell wall biosynthesis
MKKGPSISIITACYNSASTIGDTIRSVQSQSYNDVEHIVVDGGSKDETVSFARSLLAQSPRKHIIISEPDRGMYDAMRKGIDASSGDVVAVLNSDDRFESNETLEHVARAFTQDVDVLLGDVVITESDFQRVLRYYSASRFQPSDLLRGIMPPHAGFYARRALFERFGSYNPAYRYAGDFELITRFLLKEKTAFKHLPEVLVRMRTGGLSNRSLRHRYELNREVIRALRENGYSAGWLSILSKIPGKLLQYWKKAPGPADGRKHA